MRFLERIEHIARAYPDAVAQRTSMGEELTYGRLWEESDALAAYLTRRVPAAMPVIVYGNKQPLMVTCFIACMKAGCPYVPVDCFSVPSERVASIAGQIADETGRTPLVLAVEHAPQASGTSQAPGAPGVDVVTRPELERLVGERSLFRSSRSGSGFSARTRWIDGEDLAYILFTSGSTGAPKGVEVTAACFDNFCDWDLELASCAASGRTEAGAEGAAGVLYGALPAAASVGSAVWLDQAPFSFDLSVFELAGALASGGTLFSLAHDTQQDMARQLDALAASGVNVWVSTPSFAEMCLANREFSADLLPSLRLFLFCGETLPNATAARLLERFPQARVLNTYGPTESTVAVTSVEVTPKMAAAPEPLPVGVPRPGTRIRIVDANGADCPSGELGEVVIEGDTVARGYFGRHDLTTRVFGAARLGGADVRSYRTGDEGYLDRRGMLHYRGRLDLQVKLNGFRIELGEIEEHLRRLPDVAAACVVPATREGRISHLVAHVVPSGELADTPFRAGIALKEQLKDVLPHYMIPKKISFCDALPLTANGKVDRKALIAACAR